MDTLLTYSVPTTNTTTEIMSFVQRPNKVLVTESTFKMKDSGTLGNCLMVAVIIAAADVVHWLLLQCLSYRGH